jgi:hypothetical protein
MYLYIAFAIPAMVMAGVLIWHYGLLERQIKDGSTTNNSSDPSYS